MDVKLWLVEMMMDSVRKKPIAEAWRRGVLDCLAQLPVDDDALSRSIFEEFAFTPYSGHLNLWYDAAFDHVCELFEENPSRFFAHNKLFLDLVISTISHPTPVCMQRVEALYDVYLKHPNVLPYSQHPFYVALSKSKNLEGGICDRYFFHFSSHPGGPVMLFSCKKYSQLIRHKANSSAWKELYVFDRVNKEPYALLGLHDKRMGKLFNNHFPLFLDDYNKDIKNPAIKHDNAKP